MRRSLPVMALLLIAFTAYADLGPKPTVTLDVRFAGQPVEGPFQARLLDCVPRENASQRPFDEQLPANFRIREFDAGRDCFWESAEMAWGGDCAESRCQFTYMIPSEFKVAAYLPAEGKVFVSEPYTRKDFDTVLEMDIPRTGMATLRAPSAFTKPMVDLFAQALALTLALELLGTWFFCWRAKLPRSKKLFGGVVLANLISLPIVWFGFPVLGLEFLPNLVVTELFAFLFEAGFLFQLMKPLLTKRRALLLSLLNNALSLVLGGFILLIFMS